MVEKDSSIAHLLLRGHLGGGCQKEAMRLLELLQEYARFIPQSARHRAMRIEFRTEIVFSLDH